MTYPNGQKPPYETFTPATTLGIISAFCGSGVFLVKQNGVMVEFKSNPTDSNNVIQDAINAAHEYDSVLVSNITTSDDMVLKDRVNMHFNNVRIVNAGGYEPFISDSGGYARCVITGVIHMLKGAEVDQYVISITDSASDVVFDCVVNIESEAPTVAAVHLGNARTFFKYLNVTEKGIHVNGGSHTIWNYSSGDIYLTVDNGSLFYYGGKATATYMYVTAGDGKVEVYNTWLDSLRVNFEGKFYASNCYINDQRSIMDSCAQISDSSFARFDSCLIENTYTTPTNDYGIKVLSGTLVTNSCVLKGAATSCVRGDGGTIANYNSVATIAYSD